MPKTYKEEVKRATVEAYKKALLICEQFDETRQVFAIKQLIRSKIKEYE